jgi:hypothetical protein
MVVFPEHKDSQPMTARMNAKKRMLYVQLGSPLFLTILLLVQGTVNHFIFGEEIVWMKPFTLVISLVVCLMVLSQWKRHYEQSLRDLSRSFGTYAFVVGTGQILAANLISIDRMGLERSAATSAGLVLALLCVLLEKRIGIVLASIAILILPWLATILSMYWYYGGRWYVLGPY